MANLDDIHVPSLVGDICDKLGGRGGAAQLAMRLRIRDPKTIGRWIDAEHHPAPDTVRALLSLAASLGLNPARYNRAPRSLYDFNSSYEDNLRNGPVQPVDLPEKLDPCPIRLWDFVVNSPLGVPASVLTADSRWIALLLRAGYDVFEYKTVRTRAFPPHKQPNIIHLADASRTFPPDNFPARFHGLRMPAGALHAFSLANSFGLPSQSVGEWQEDVQRTLRLLADGQALIVSVVGTPDEKTDLVPDFVRCAELAYELRPHAICLNISCPNTFTDEGKVFKSVELAARICAAVRKACPDTKLLAKIGYLPEGELRRFFEKTYKFLDGYIAINTRPAAIYDRDAQPHPQKGEPPVFAAHDSERLQAGVSGIAIQESALEVIRNLSRLRQIARRDDIMIFGTGGVFSPDDVIRFQEAGANVIGGCTAVMYDIGLAARAREALRARNDARNGDGEARIRREFERYEETCREIGVHPADHLSEFNTWATKMRAYAGVPWRTDSEAEDWRSKLRRKKPF